MSSNKEQLTPLMQQYVAIKKEYSDALVLFQVGDFYELFFDDARTASSFLGITLTKRGVMHGEPIPLCGVPVHALNHYLTKLIRGGFKVALCDQLEPAQPGKVVARGVTRLFTPGTLVETPLLDEKSASYVCTFVPLAHEWGLLFGELLTAQLFATTIAAGTQRVLESELSRFIPDEVLVPNVRAGKQFQAYFKKLGYFSTVIDLAQENEGHEESELGAYFSEKLPFINEQAPEISSYVQNHASLKLSLHTLYTYLRKTQPQQHDQFTSLHIYQPEDFLIIDAATSRNLELVKNNRDGSSKQTLFSILDHAKTAMGSRTIKKWIMRPLIAKDSILQRHNAVESACGNILFLQQIRELLAHIGDIERIVGRIALRKAQFSDYRALASALEYLPSIKALLYTVPNELLNSFAGTIAPFENILQLLKRALNDNDEKEWCIKAGFDQSLDAMRAIIDNTQNALVELEKKEQEKTGIGSLKVRYNTVHGYYIEITKTHRDIIPDYYKRQQTLVGRERYMIPELYELQHALFRSRNEIEQKEKELFEYVKSEVLQQVRALRSCAYTVAQIDALCALAHVALENRYVKPHMNEERTIVIQQGRHPVIEQEITHRFIANDTNLHDAQSLWIITGPNMGGKSTYLRQVALICIMAHMGCLVPADAANIAVLDRIFTRIGAGDSLAEGKSTFLVEMEETASICTYATANSLVILDEVGRGTSTFDGLALAQAVVEYIYTAIQARCLFATHYHELALLKDALPGVVSYYAASKKTAEGIIFLYTMVEGIANGSFGIEVAKLAQVPPSIIQRAQQVLKDLEHTTHSKQVLKDRVSEQVSHEDVSRYRAAQHIIAHLENVDYENLSPKQAFDILWQLKDIHIP
jgi:DNA mismatch repair protein MutS